MVGPEGGFSEPEIKMMEQTPGLRFVSLGDSVLRSETAAITALGCVAVFRSSTGRV